MNEDDRPAKLPDAVLMEKIYVIRGKKVMFDYDLAALYGIETKQLKRAVRRNISRFPDDFMIELAVEEFDDLRSQFGTSSVEVTICDLHYFKTKKLTNIA